MTRTAENPPSRVENWSDLSKLIEYFSYFSAHDWLFRGVTDAGHALVAKVGREKTRGLKKDLKSKVSKRVPYRLADERGVFTMFKSQALSHIQRAPTTQLEWLALAQHFGMPTRLLDWTESILVAAWFAVEKAGVKENKADAAIWITKGVPALDTDNTGDPFEIKAPGVYRPAHISPRISAQASVLMLCPTPTKEVKLKFAHKVTIAREVEFTIKKRLNACGVNRRLLFPDLAGLAEHLTWLHKHDYLAGYRHDARSKVRPTPDEEDR